jgi:hypothetical protein
MQNAKCKMQNAKSKKPSQNFFKSPPWRAGLVSAARFLGPAMESAVQQSLKVSPTTLNLSIDELYESL